MTGLVALVIAVSLVASTDEGPMSRSPHSPTVEPFPFLPDGGISVGCLTLRTGMTMSALGGFGGISGVVLDGEDLLLLADSGQIWIGKANRGRDGILSGLGPLTKHPIRDKTGVPLTKSGGDSEAILIRSSGDLTDVLIAFERDHRIERAVTDTSGGLRTQGVLYRPDLPDTASNRGIEAMTELSDGRIFVVTEYRDDTGGAGAAVLASDGEPNAQFLYRPAAGFAVTDAATDPGTGQVILLERAFSRLRGPRARLLALPPDAFERADGSTLPPGRLLASLSWLEGIDNMEALAVERRAEDGQILIHLFSDDNFNPLQRSIVLGLSGPESCLLFPPEARSGPDSTAEPMIGQEEE